MSTHRIFTTAVASVYPHYVTKAEKKGRTRAEVDAIIRWLTGYTQRQLTGTSPRARTFRRSLRRLLA